MGRSQWRQCDALSNVLLVNLGSSMWMLLWHVPPAYPLLQTNVHPIMEKVLLDGCGQFQQNNVPCREENMVQHNDESEVLTAKFPSSQSSCASVGFTGQTRGPTLLLKGSAQLHLRLYRSLLAGIKCQRSWKHIYKGLTCLEGLPAESLFSLKHHGSMA